MSSLRLLGNIFDLEILFGERSGIFIDYGCGRVWKFAGGCGGGGIIEERLICHH